MAACIGAPKKGHQHVQRLCTKYCNFLKTIFVMTRLLVKMLVSYNLYTTFIFVCL